MTGPIPTEKITIEELMRHMDMVFENCKALAQQRGDNYASRTDTLKVFTEVADNVNLAPWVIANILVEIKIARFRENIRNGVDYRDSMLDLMVYLNFFDILKKQQLKAMGAL